MVSFPPQPVITRDNLVVSIDTVIYFQVTDARAATYEVADYISAVEQPAGPPKTPRQGRGLSSIRPSSVTLVWNDG